MEKMKQNLGRSESKKIKKIFRGAKIIIRTLLRFTQPFAVIFTEVTSEYLGRKRNLFRSKRKRSN